MSSVMQPLRVEHHALAAHLEYLRRVADEVGEVDGKVTRAAVDDVYDFLVRHLLPHAQAEEEVLYPAVDRILGAAGATATMSRDHVEVIRFTERLGELRGMLRAGQRTPTLVRDLRATLYGLHAIVVLHFAKEEENYVPLLDSALDADAADELFRRMGEAAVRAVDV